MTASTQTSVVVTLSAEQVERLDCVVGAGLFDSRDEVVREALESWLRKADTRFKEKNSFSYVVKLRPLGGVQPGSPFDIFQVAEARPE